MDSTMTALTELAEDLTNRVDALEKENAALRKQAAEASQVKQASAQEPAVKSVVSEQVIENTLSAMVKAGALEESQRDEGRQCFAKDPEAPHRILQHILDAQIQTKTAAAASDNIEGGKLAAAEVLQKTAEEECLDRMCSLLGLNN